MSCRIGTSWSVRGKCFFVFLLIVPVLWANSVEERAYRSFISGNFSHFKGYIEEVRANKNQNETEVIRLLDYQYNYIAFLFRTKRKGEAEKELKQFDATLKHLERMSPQSPELWAFKAYQIGYIIRLSPYNAPFIASDALKFARKAVAVGAQSPWGYFALGNNFLYAPEAFGGDKEEAVKAYLKAVSLFEKKGALENDFEYLHCMRMLAEAYKQSGDYERAIQVCQKILSKEPQYRFIKEVLLVELNRQKKKK